MKVAKNDEVEAGKVMFDNCWLGGSEELRTDALLFMAVQKQLGTVLNGFQGLIKNLYRRTLWRSGTMRTASPRGAP
ncbi:MAG: hypothetical protein HDS92_04235 [Bacteroidales bacterium]|nr:hypothetical protein [Bacteroidales bacterium]